MPGSHDNELIAARTLISRLRIHFDNLPSAFPLSLADLLDAYDEAVARDSRTALADDRRASAQRVHILGPNLPDQSSGGFHVHRYGCVAVPHSYPPRVHGLYRDQSWSFDATSRRAIVEEIYSDVMGDSDPPAPWTDYAADVHIFPCVNLPVE